MEEDKPQILLWTVPEYPFRVTIPSTVLNEARIHAVEAFYSVPRGGVEVGGVFFGVRDSDLIRIQARRPIHCEYSTGPSFTLSISDQLGLSGLLDQAASDPDLAGMMPLGWYHSHTRSDLFLSPADLELYNEFFHEKWQVALVLRPTNLQATRGGFFFRDRSGNLKSDAPVQEFKMEPPGFGLALFDSQGPATAPQATPDAVSTAVLNGQADRALTASAAVVESVPLVTVPVPAIAAEPSGPTPESVPEPILAAAEASPSDAAVVEPPVVAAPEPESQRDPEKKPLAARPFQVGLPSFDLAESLPEPKRKTGWIRALAVIILMVASAAGGAAFFKWGKVGSPVGLGLEVYDINGAFLIRWDRLSSGIRDATGATLEIDDGGEKSEPIPLTPDELSIGGYGYMRRTAHVSVHLKVNGPQSLEEYRNFEGVQALGSRPTDTPDVSNALSQALAEKEHLTTELINESMRSAELRKEITSLRKQLAEERARNAAAPPAR